MIFGLFVMITALSISAVAIYYSVSGLVAIFAAAAIPIIVMGTALEVGKLVTAVWLHWYWRKAAWWLKTYLSIAVLVLMFITSMGIFGFLSKAHIEQTAAADEGIAQIARIDEDIARQEYIISRAEERIVEADASVGKGNDAIQAQIDKEQERIDTAYIRIEPAIEEQQGIIANARENDKDRTKPFEEQLVNIQNELVRLESSAAEYESTIAGLQVDVSAVDPIRAQIITIQDQISKVEGQIASGEREQIKQAQTTIGANADGAAGPNTRRAANAWIENQRNQIQDLNARIATLQEQAIQTVDTERQRLSAIVTDIRNNQIPALKDREVQMLAKIEQVRSTESPVIIRAREEMTRIRASADRQIAASNTLIQQLRDSLTVGKDPQVEQVVAEQNTIIIEANNSIDELTKTKYALQTEYRKLEAEVGPIKYLAEFIYGETDKDILEEAVRWVIITIIFVFDPLAVLLLIASQATFEMRREAKDHADKESHRKARQEYEQQRAARILANPGYHPEKSNDNESNDNQHVEHAQPRDKQDGHNETKSASDTGTSEVKSNDSGEDERDPSDDRTSNDGGVVTAILSAPEQEERRQELEVKEEDSNYRELKQNWKQDHPEDTLKRHKEAYIIGKIDTLPWEGYKQNSEQSNDSIWQRIKDNDID
jgi:hypothetical protein